MNWNIQLSELNYDLSEQKAVEHVVRNEWLTMGSKCIEFEEKFSIFHDYHEPSVFVSSATAGLHLILMSLQVGQGDEIILPALTFVSDANVVKQLGATPVFADSVSISDLNVSTIDVVNKITNKTRAVIVVHFAGFPKDLTELKKICGERGIALIEDCAHAPGAQIGSEFCGTFGDFAFFSFFSNKNLAVGEGGMVFAKDSQKMELIRSMRSHGMSSLTLDRHLGRATTYDVTSIGLNYRPDELRAALGLEQLKKLASGNAKRRALTNRYIKNLHGSTIVVPFSDKDEGIVSACHIMPIILPKSADRSLIMDKMKQAGIQTSIHYPSFASFSIYNGSVDVCSLLVASEICERELSLPLHPRLSIKDVDLVSEELLRSFA